MTDLSRPAADAGFETTHRLRFVTAASLFDGHDASINIIRRLRRCAAASSPAMRCAGASSSSSTSGTST